MVSQTFRKNLILFFIVIGASGCYGMELILEKGKQVGAIFNIKDTDSVVSDQYKHLSLVQGAIGWEFGFVRRLYDFGEIYPIWGKNEELNQSFIVGYNEGGHATVRLVHALFYRIPGSRSDTDFKETTFLRKQKIIETKEKEEKSRIQQTVDITDEDILMSFADMLICCTRVRAGLLELSDTISQLNKLLPHIQKLDQIVALQNVKIGSVPLAKAEIKAQGHGDHVEKIKNLKAEIILCLKGKESLIKPLFVGLKEFEQKIHALFEPAAYKCLSYKGKESVAITLLGSLLECDPSDKEYIYMPYTTEMILLTFVYKVFGHDKQKIKFFYEYLNTGLENKFLVSEMLPENWNTSRFDRVSIEIASEKLESLFKETKPALFCEDILFYSTQVTSYPIPNSFLTVPYAPKNKTITFPDCMDNTFRNFIRLLTFNIKTRKCEGGVLEKRGIKNYATSLKEFLNVYQDSQTDGLMNAHSEWLKVISNIEGALYRQTLDNEKPVRADGIKTYAFLFSKEKMKHEERLKSKKIAITQSCGYEIKANVHNLIVVLDYLLGLKLFSNKSVCEEVVKKDFIKFYFPLLCKALGCKNFLVASKEPVAGNIQEIEEREDLSIFDELDCKQDVFVMLQFETFTCRFTLRPNHGEMIVSSDNYAVDIDTQELNFSERPSLGLVATHLLNQSPEKQLVWLEKNMVYSNLFTLPLENTTLLPQIVEIVMSALPWQQSAYTRNLLLRLIDKFPDEQLRLPFKGMLMQKLLVHRDQSSYPLASEVALQLMKHDIVEAREMGSSILQLLLDNKYERAIEDAFKITREAMQSENGEVRLFGLSVLNQILREEQKDTYQQIMEIAIKRIGDPDNKVIAEALKVLRWLVWNRYEGSYEEAAKVALESIVHNNEDVGLAAFELLKALFAEKDEESFKQAAAFAEKEIVNKENENFYRVAYLIFEALFKHKRGYEEAKRALEKMKKMKDMEEEAQDLEELISKKHYY